MNALQFLCPHCGYTAAVPASAAGQQVGCPGCARPVVIGGGAGPPEVIDFACPRCGSAARVPAAFAGQQAQCRSCAAVIPVPAAAPAPAAARGPAPAPSPAPSPAAAGAPAAGPGTIVFHCACGNRIEVAAVHAGTQGACSACGGAVRVPDPHGSAQAPSAPQPQPPAPSAPPPQQQQQQPAAGTPIVFNCPTCQTLSQVDAAYAGQQGQCAACGGLMWIPHESSASAAPPAPAAAPPATAPRRAASQPAAFTLDLAEPDPEPPPPAPAEAEEAEEAEEEPEAPARGRKKGRGRSASASGSGSGSGSGSVERQECPFCFAKIPQSASSCPACQMDLAPAAPPSRGRGRGRARARGAVSVRIFEALEGGFSDFVNNALVCVLAVVIFQIGAAVASGVAGAVGALVAGVLASIPGLVIGVLIAIVISMVAISYLLQGLCALWLACARDEEVGLGLLFRQPLSKAISGFAVQVVITIAYVGLCVGIGAFASMLAKAVGPLVGVICALILFFVICCLLVLMAGISQIYIADQGLGAGAALAAANAAVSAAAGNLIAYAALCVGALFFVSALVGGGLYALGIAPDPLAPSPGKLLLCALIEGGASLAFLSVMGSSLTRIYLQLIERR